MACWQGENGEKREREREMRQDDLDVGSSKSLRKSVASWESSWAQLPGEYSRKGMPRGMRHRSVTRRRRRAAWEGARAGGERGGGLTGNRVREEEEKKDDELVKKKGGGRRRTNSGAGRRERRKQIRSPAGRLDCTRCCCFNFFPGFPLETNYSTCGQWGWDVTRDFTASLDLQWDTS